MSQITELGKILPLNEKTKIDVYVATGGIVKPATLINWVKITEEMKTLNIFFALCDYVRVETIAQAKVLFGHKLCKMLHSESQNQKTPTAK